MKQSDNLHLRVFEARDHKRFLRSVIEENTSVKGLYGKLAEAAGCQPSYFSKVLNTHVHLTPDHMAGICQYLQMTTEETDYLLELLQYERASHPALKKRCAAKMDELRAKSRRVDRRISAPSLSQHHSELRYYSSWLYAAVHVATSIPKFQSEAETPLAGAQPHL